MEYINDININEAVIHILDSNGDEPILNEYSLELDENIYEFLYKHLEKCFKDEVDCQHFLIHFLFGHICKSILNWSHIV